MRYFILLFGLFSISCGGQGQPGQSIQGPQGSPGSPGTQIGEVQLCPGTPVYPNTFVEFAQCVDGDLYAVYSANDGFWTYLPPGNYQSNAIGSSCNFQVVFGCTVVPL